MPNLRTYHLFVSHPWNYDEYSRIIEFLDATPNFSYKDYSVSYAYPLEVNSKTKLQEALRRQIRLTHVVLIPAGMEVNFREWIKFEIDVALSWNKPIIGIVPWGGQRIPSAVRDAASEIVGWNAKSIVGAIRRNAI